jgi:hypothetical protein
MDSREFDSSHLGLDFGTSTTLLARSRGISGLEILPLGHATEWLPSIVGYDKHDSVPQVGEAAEGLLPGHIIRSVKRAITFNSESVSLDLNDSCLEVSADEIASMIVREALVRAGADALKGIAGIRAACPAMWDRDQRLRLLSILAECGLDVPLMDLIDEPIAAAIAWVNHRRLQSGEQVEGRLLVFDYGGGTLDVAVCDIEWDQDLPEITVMSCLGVPLAGDTLDDRLYAYARDQLISADGFEDSAEQRAAILREVRLAKERLSTSLETTLRLKPYGLADLQLTRAELEREFRPQLADAVDVAFGALKAARLRENSNLSTAEIRGLPYTELSTSVDFVLLAGGMSQVPAVGDELQKFFSRARVERIEPRSLGGVRSPQHLVVAGLVQDHSAYDGLNLHRPGFNIRLEWTSRSGATEGQDLYQAHSALYSTHAIQAGGLLGFRSSIKVPLDVRGTEGQIVVTSDSGQPLALRLDGVQIPGLPLVIHRSQEVVLTLKVDGRMLVSIDGQQPRFGHGGLRIERWQVVRGPSSARRQIDLITHEIDGPKNYPYPHK